jgi:hypothetical protein
MTATGTSPQSELMLATSHWQRLIKDGVMGLPTWHRPTAHRIFYIFREEFMAQTAHRLEHLRSCQLAELFRNSDRGTRSVFLYIRRRSNAHLFIDRN